MNVNLADTVQFKRDCYSENKCYGLELIRNDTSNKVNSDKNKK